MQFVSDFWRESNLPESGAMIFEFALEEIFTNIMKYGLAPDSKSDVLVRLDLRLGCVELLVSDAGQPFDPKAAIAPDVHLDLDERTVGGLGLFMVQEMMDNFSYIHKSGRNVVVMGKKFTPDIPK